MTYHADLTRGDVTSVGYLGNGHDYPEGETSEAVFDRLASLVMLRVVCWMGYHHCDLGVCRSNQPQPDFYWRGMKIPRCCSSDILVPGKAVVYMAPALILHYIRTHRYLPPACFLEAVLDGPEPGSAEYLDAIRKTAPKFVEFFAVSHSGGPGLSRQARTFQVGSGNRLSNGTHRRLPPDALPLRRTGTGPTSRRRSRAMEHN